MDELTQCLLGLEARYNQLAETKGKSYGILDLDSIKVASDVAYKIRAKVGSDQV